jgi:DNA-binding transcriptional MerR regulator
MSQNLQIGQVSKSTGLTVDAIRFYEKQKLLRRASRSAGGFRLYNERDLQDINFIRRAQELGFSLNEIRELLILQGEDVEACSHVRELLEGKVAAVEEKILQLRKLHSQLASRLKQCERSLKSKGNGHGPETSCPVLVEIAQQAGKE